MQLDEAIALRQAHLHGSSVDRELLEQAKRRINIGNTIAAANNNTWPAEPIHQVLRERSNRVLICNLAMACGLLVNWGTKW